MSRLADLESQIAAVQAMVTAIQPRNGLGIWVADMQGGQGRSINLKSISQGGVGGSNQGLPWEIIGGDGTVSVSKNSPLRYSQVMDDIVTIVDIDNDFTPAAGDLFYLDIALDGSYGIDSVTLTIGTPWANYSFPYTTTGAGTLGDPFIVTNAYYLIGYCIDTTDDTAEFLDGPVITLMDESQVKVVRCCYAPLLFQWQNMGGGFVIPYPDPPSMPGPPA